jgi:hypothetical protein
MVRAIIGSGAAGRRLGFEWTAKKSRLQARFVRRLARLSHVNKNEMEPI